MPYECFYIIIPLAAFKELGFSGYFGSVYEKASMP
jgi:hypothetical protein